MQCYCLVLANWVRKKNQIELNRARQVGGGGGWGGGDAQPASIAKYFFRPC